MEDFEELKRPIEWAVGSDKEQAGIETGLQTGVRNTREIIKEYHDGTAMDQSLCLLRWVSSSLAQKEK